MDKYEFRHLWEEIQGLMAQGRYADAAALADKIDWRRVKNTATLEKVGDLYRINRRFEDARDILLFAYDRKSDNKQICYSLCEIYCKTGDLTEASEYYKEYEKLAPRDYRRYILKYKLYCAADTNIDERIEVLEKLKDESPQEKWMYELAKLYDKRGLATKCAEVCDELVLWFGEGKYVNMALELKRLHEPLTEKQQEIYDNRFQQGNVVTDAGFQPDDSSNAYGENGYDNYSDQMNSAYDNYAVQEESAYGGMEENVGAYAEEYHSANDHENHSASEPEMSENGENAGNTRMFDVNAVRQQMKQQEARQLAQAQQENSVGNFDEDDMDIQIKTVDVGRFNTMNLQAEIAKGMQEMLNAEGDSLKEQFPKEPEEELAQEAERERDDELSKIDHGESVEDMINKQVMNEMRADQRYSDNVNPLVKQAMTAQPPEAMAQVLTQESDGQICFVMPEGKRLEKQITGQMSIEDIRAEWEQIKQKNKEKHEEELRQQVQRHTGQMFTEFEAKIRDSILAKMESGDTVFSQHFQGNLDGKQDFENPDMTKWDQEDDEATSEDDTFEMESLGDMNDPRMLFDSIETETGEEKKDREVTAVEEVAEEKVEETEGSIEKEIEESEEESEGNAEEEKEESVTETTEESAEEEKEEVTTETKEETEAKEDIKEETEKGNSDHQEGKFEGQDDSRDEIKDYVEEASGKKDFYWDGEDNWGEENDFEFEQENGQDRLETQETDSQEMEYASEENADENYESDENYNADGNYESDENYEADENYESDENDDMMEVSGISNDDNIDFERLPREENESGEEDSSNENGETLQDTEMDDEGNFDEKDSEEDGDGIDYEGFSSEETEQEETENEEESTGKLPVRELSKDEEALYESLLQGQVNREQLARAIDAINMAPYVGNVVITGEADMNTLELAKRMVKEIKASDSNFVGSAIKMTGKALNARDVAKQILDLKNGAMIIDKPNQMSEETTDTLYKMLQREDLGIVVFLLDSRKGINAFFKNHENLRPMFNAHVHMKPISEEALARYARKYAYDNEFSIDSMGMLALHTRIDEMQTAQHAVTYDDIKEVMDDAMDSASAISVGHFFDILFGRRYDEEDMIVITEKDFR